MGMSIIPWLSRDEGQRVVRPDAHALDDEPVTAVIGLWKVQTWCISKRVRQLSL